jgi:hypothetical protein
VFALEVFRNKRQAICFVMCGAQRCSAVYVNQSLYDRIVFIGARLFSVPRVLRSSLKGGYLPVLEPTAYLILCKAFKPLFFIFARNTITVSVVKGLEFKYHC